VCANSSGKAGEELSHEGILSSKCSANKEGEKEREICGLKATIAVLRSQLSQASIREQERIIMDWQLGAKAVLQVGLVAAEGQQARVVELTSRVQALESEQNETHYLLLNERNIIE
jgi:hypothetical protein